MKNRFRRAKIWRYITVFPQIGQGYSVSAVDYRPSDWKMPQATYRKILYDLSRFKK